MTDRSMSNILNYRKGHPFVFISYSSKDKPTIVEDVIELQKRGVNVWFDADLTVGTDWFNNEVKPKILQCKAVLLYISKNSIQSKQVLKEIETAIERKKQIIPVCLLPVASAIGNYVDEYSHELDTDAETAYEMAKKISGDNTFIPHKTDKDYYDALIEKGIKRLAPGAINLQPDSPLSFADANDAYKAKAREARTPPIQTELAAPVSESAPFITARASLQAIPADSPDSAADLQRSFSHWLSGIGKSEAAVTIYIDQLRGTLVRELKAEDIVSVNLFEYQNVQKFEAVCEVIRRLPGLLMRNSAGHDDPKAALNAYSDFLKSIQASHVPQQPVTPAAYTFSHTLTNTDITYGLICFKKSTGIPELLSPNMPVTLLYKGIRHETKVHPIKLGRISNAAFVRNIPAGTELSIAFDGVDTFTLTDAYALKK